MKQPQQVLSEEAVALLWREGYTIVRRQNDPFEIDPKLIPRGMAYQWNDAGRENPGWREVPYTRHPGVFGPWGAQGSVEIGNLYLCERPKAEVEAEHDKAHAKAYQNVTDWMDRQAKDGFVGGVTFGIGPDSPTRRGVLKDMMKPVEISEDGGMAQLGQTKTIETIVAIPTDMQAHVLAIFKERDRLEGEVVRKDRTLAPGPIADKFYAAIEADKGAPWWPTLRAILLPIAVDNVRANLKKESNDE